MNNYLLFSSHQEIMNQNPYTKIMKINNPRIHILPIILNTNTSVRKSQGGF